MAATSTTWHPRTVMQPREWLLTNGEVVKEPPLEETQSGRKVRIAGTTTSMFSKDVNALIWEGVQALAKTKGEKAWMALDEKAQDQAERNHYGNRLVRGGKASLHLLKAARNGNHYGEHTTAWWRFRHPTLPIEAVLLVAMSQAHTRVGLPLVQEVKTALLMPSTNPSHGESVHLINCASQDFAEWRDTLTSSDHRQRFKEFLRDNKPNWDGEFTLREQSIQGERTAVRSILTDVENIDGFDKIDVPDLRNPERPAWMSLELQDTNVHGAFLQELKDYLDGGSVVEEVRKHWTEMVRLLRSAGLVLDVPKEESFAAALAGGEPVTISVQSPAQDVNHTVDPFHQLTLHLPTGTMIVNCTHKASKKDEVAHKWEEAVTMASLTGQEDELLAYARRFAETENARRAKTILSERRDL